MAQQTTENLKPYVKVREFLKDEPSSALSDNLFLIGHTSIAEVVDINDYAVGDRVSQNGKIYVNIQATSGANNDPATDTAYWTYTGFDLYKPIDVGQITSLSTAISICSKLGLKYRFTSSTELDLLETDELAYMIIKSALFYEAFTPSRARYTLSPLNYSVALLSTTTVNTKTSSPFGDGTNNVFISAENMSLRADVIVQPYEYAQGDAAATSNYFEEYKTYCDSVNNQGDPTRGNNFAIFADISTTVANLPTNLDDTGFVRSANIIYPNSNPSVTAASLASQVAVIYQGVGTPFPTVVGEVFPNLALPKDDEVLNSDLRASVLQYGWSPLVSNKQRGIVTFSRIISASLVDPVTNVARDNSLDSQDFRIDFYARSLIYNRIVDSGLLNTRYTVNSQGVVASAEEIKNIMINVDTQLYLGNMIAVNPKIYKDEYKVVIDQTDPNRFICTKPIYPSASLIQIDVSQTAKGFIPLLDKFNIVGGI